MGQRIGPYEVVRELARGGMGVVYVAHDPALDREVALKVVAPGALGPEALARFRREGLAAARLRHPNIVGVHAVGALPSGLPYLVMDLVEGASLHARVAREGPLPIGEAVRLAAAIARALQHAHARGVLHRDLKPANVLVDDQGAPQVTDFGLARLLDARSRVTATGELLGTAAYMAPEQARGDHAQVGPATDVYGLGAVLYELLTGRPPFGGLAGLAALEAVMTRPPDPPRALRAEVDPTLDELVMRCLEKDPARRFASAEALAAALETWGRSRAGGRPRRRASVAPLVLAVGALVCSSIAAGWSEAGRRTAVAAEAAAVASAAEVAAATDAAVESAGRARGAAIAAERARAAALLACTATGGDAAIAALTSALDLVQDPTNRADLHARRALAHAEAGALVEAGLDLAAAERLGVDAPLVTFARWSVARRARSLGPDELVRALADLERAAGALRGLDLAGARALRALLSFGAGDVLGARSAIDALIQDAPSLPDVREVRSYLRQGSNAGAADGLFEDELACALLAPAAVEGWALLASAALRAGDLTRARAAIDRALERRAEAISFAMRARVRLATGEVRGALEDAEAGVRCSPTSRSAIAVRDDARARLDEARAAARELVRRARRDDPRRLVPALNAALRADPDDLDLRAWRAMLRLDRGDVAPSEADVAAVLSSDPGHAIAQVARARADLLRGRGLEGAARLRSLPDAERLPEALVPLAAVRLQADPAEALRLLDEALRLAPDDGRARAARCNVLILTGDLEGAAAEAERATRAAPWLARAWVALAVTRDQLGAEPAAARAAVDRALALEESPRARALRAQLRGRAGEHAGALSDAERAVELGVPLEQVRSIRERALAALGKDGARVAALAVAAHGHPRDADLALSRELGRRPDDLELRAWRAVARAALGRHAAAEADVEAVLRRDPTQAVAVVALSMVAAADGRVDQAVTLAARAVELRPDLALVRAQLAATLAAGRDHQRARAEVEEALRLDPALAGALSLRALLRYGDGDEQGARADAERAARLAPWNAQAWALVAVTRAYGGDDEGAITAADWTLAVGGENAEARLARGFALAHMERFDEALHDLDAAQRLNPGDVDSALAALQALDRLGRADDVLRRGRALLERLAADDPLRAEVERLVEAARRRAGR